ncbi:MAG: hypothetical protein JNN13_18700 [Planctomycetes bacterium]|nr:hypothetical protein [Planctomycetota bacterium]
MRDDRLELADHFPMALRVLTFVIALGFVAAAVGVFSGAGGDLGGRLLAAVPVCAVLAVLLGFGLGTRTTVLDRAAGTGHTSFRVLGRRLFAKTFALSDFTRIRAHHVRAYRESSFRISLVGPAQSQRIYRSGPAAPARVALGRVVDWLGWPVDDEVGLLAPPARGAGAS